MGVTHVNVVTRFLVNPSRSREGRLLVDAVAINPPVSGPHPYTADLDPDRQWVYELTDGSKVEREVTTGGIELVNEMIPGLIVIGDAHAEPPVGVTALASVGVAVNPQSQRLETLGSVRLKRNTAR